jgi:hypothetical protein
MAAQSPITRGTIDEPVISGAPTLTLEAGGTTPSNATATLTGGLTVPSVTPDASPIRFNTPYLTSFNSGLAFSPHWQYRNDGYGGLPEQQHVHRQVRLVRHRRRVLRRRP